MARLTTARAIATLRALPNTGIRLRGSAPKTLAESTASCASGFSAR